MIPICDGIRRMPSLAGEGLLGEILGPSLRTVAETKRRGVVPPRAFIIGSAEKNFVANIRMLEADADA